MLQIPLDQLTEEHLKALERDGIAEGLTLEFKQTVDLDDRRQAQEAAKDVSALANTAGGRILYGVSERMVDGEPVAGPLTPLADGGLRERLENVLADSIQPRLQFQARNVPVNGGHVLVVEVYPSTGVDLHMVSSFKEGRYYQRQGSRSVPMTEPEIRESYGRIASDWDRRKERLEVLIEEEVNHRPTAQLSILVVPVFSTSINVDPRLKDELAPALAGGPLKVQDEGGVVSNLRPYGDGLRGFYPERNGPSSAETYFRISREGVLHFSRREAFLQHLGASLLNLPSIYQDLLAVIEGASVVYERVAYWGPSQVVFRINPPRESMFYPYGRVPLSIDSGVHQIQIDQRSLRAAPRDLRLLVKEIFDRLFQTAGRLRCDHIDDEGRPTGILAG